jgi:AcrR family transcriptional regulator
MIKKHSSNAAGTSAGCIVGTAIIMVKNDGWNKFSIRKLAKNTGLSVPSIYKFFPSKGDLLTQLISVGFLKLSSAISNTPACETDPLRRVHQIWLAYWNFAFSEKELYQLMFGINILNNNVEIKKKEVADFLSLISKALTQVVCAIKVDNDMVRVKSLTLWSTVHGLISLNYIKQNGCIEVSEQLITEAINLFLTS